MEPALRVAGDADLDLVVDFMRRYNAADGLPFDEARARDALGGLIGDRVSGVVWLICDGTMPVGCIVLTFGYSLEYHGRDAFIDEFFIQPSHRGRGWGRQALQFMEDASRELGVHALHLEVTHANTGAQKLYRKFGFEDHDRYLMTKRI
jgi:ribosomal protein S18 acetylase RimI-like enzyme